MLTKKQIGIMFAIFPLVGVLTSSTVYSATETQRMERREFIDTHSHWGYQTINWAVQNTVVEGYPDGSFRPDKQVTEAEFIKMMIKMFQPTNLNLTGEHSHWADPYYMFAAEMNYPVLGTNDLNQRNLAITRQSVADLVVGTQGVNYVGNSAIQYLLGNGLASGKGQHKTIEGFDPNGYLTRAEAVQFLKNLKEYGNQTLKPRPNTPSDLTKLPELPEKVDHSKKHEEINKNPASLKDINTLISFVRSLPSSESYSSNLRKGSYDDILLGTESRYGYNVRIEYSDSADKKVTIAFTQLKEPEKAFLKEFLKVFYPQSSEQVYKAAIASSNKFTSQEQKVFEGKKTTFFSTGNGDLRIWVGVK
ncbi:S-layer homology domain-containing protein [Brevibacillus sp. NPDC003359]|uniref:S-layer homology domain-containing protein n=1 Tax=unclassified Brevibacillus TaxID=2684853 RepID=UPI0036AA843B